MVARYFRSLVEVQGESDRALSFVYTGKMPAQFPCKGLTEFASIPFVMHWFVPHWARYGTTLLLITVAVWWFNFILKCLRCCCCVIHLCCFVFLSCFWFFIIRVVAFAFRLFYGWACLQEIWLDLFCFGWAMDHQPRMSRTIAQYFVILRYLLPKFSFDFFLSLQLQPRLFRLHYLNCFPFRPKCCDHKRLTTPPISSNI